MVSNSILTIVSIIVGFIAFVFGMVGLCTNNWLTFANSPDTIGLWKVCDALECADLKIGAKRAYFAYEIVRGFSMLAVVMVTGGIGFGMVSLLAKKININNSVLATFFILGAMFALIGASVYTSLAHEAGTNWGYSFVLTWLAFPISLISGSVMLYATFSSD